MHPLEKNAPGGLALNYHASVYIFAPLGFIFMFPCLVQPCFWVAEMCRAMASDQEGLHCKPMQTDHCNEGSSIPREGQAVSTAGTSMHCVSGPAHSPVTAKRRPLTQPIATAAVLTVPSPLSGYTTDEYCKGAIETDTAERRRSTGMGWWCWSLP